MSLYRWSHLINSPWLVLFYLTLWLWHYSFWEYFLLHRASNFFIILFLFSQNPLTFLFFQLGLVIFDSFLYLVMYSLLFSVCWSGSCSWWSISVGVFPLLLWAYTHKNFMQGSLWGLDLGWFLWILHILLTCALEAPANPGPFFFFNDFFFKGTLFLFIYLFGCVGSLLLRRLSLVAVSRGYSSLRWAGFSLQWLLLLRSTGSRHAGFSSCGSQAQ